MGGDYANVVIHKYVGYVCIRVSENIDCGISESKFPVGIRFDYFLKTKNVLL